MGCWGPGLYQDDDAEDLKNSIALLAKLPVDGDRLLEILLANQEVPPDFDNDDAAIHYVLCKTPDRLSQSALGSHVADGAEQTHQGIVPLPDAQLHHILADEPAGGIFATRLLDEPRLEVNAIDRESMLPQMARVLAGTARDVEDALRGRCATTDELGQVS